MAYGIGDMLTILFYYCNLLPSPGIPDLTLYLSLLFVPLWFNMLYNLLCLFYYLSLAARMYVSQLLAYFVRQLNPKCLLER